VAGSRKSGDKSSGAQVVRLRPPRKCPICGKDAVHAYYPFCSKRCADIDLNRWLSGAYAIPAVEGAEADEPDDDERD
jgi:endogenous inhibitor of DNA gyrase (YacG/DUF329 family)